MRDKEEIERTSTSVLMNNAFETGEILNAPEETLQRYLLHLSTEAIPNENVRHRAIIQALTINHIQMQRHIDKLNKRNTFLTVVVIILMVVTIAVTIIVGYQTYPKLTSQQTPKKEATITQPPVQALPSKTLKEVHASSKKELSIRKQMPLQQPTSTPKAYETPK
jgi:hypothetical protein